MAVRKNKRMLSIVPSNQFKKDLKLAKKRGCNLDLLSEVVGKLSAEEKLEEKYHDHNLTSIGGCEGG